MCITSDLAHRQQWKTSQHGIAFSIRSFVRHLKSKLSQPLLQPPSCSTNTIFFSSWNADYSGGQIKLPNESCLVSIYSLVSSAGNTNSLKRCQSLQVGICMCKYCIVNPKNMSVSIQRLQFGSMKSCDWLDKKYHVMHPSYSEFYYSAVVLWVYVDVHYDLNTHHIVCLSVDLWSHVYFPFKHARHMCSQPASRSTFS